MSKAPPSTPYWSTAPAFHPADAPARGTFPLLVSETAPTATQYRVACTIIALLAAAFVGAAPFYSLDLPVISAFVPVVHAIVCVTGLIAAAFLLSQYALQRQRAFLILASGYMLASLFAFFQSLAFPHAYSEAGVLGGSPSAAAWLFLAWRTSLPLGVIGYALTQRPAPAGPFNHSTGLMIALTISAAMIVACGLTWFVAVAQQHLPVLFSDAFHEASIAPLMTLPAIAFSLGAILLLIAGPRTTLDLWLVVTLLAALPDIILPVSRYALGFYLARGCEVISSCAVLIALLTESATLYARIASAKSLQTHAEAERLSCLETATAAIAHELRQPLTAIQLHAQTCALLVAAPKPCLADVGQMLGDIDKHAGRASEVLERIRGGLRRQDLHVKPLDIGDLVANAVELFSEEAAARQMAVAVRLTNERLWVAGDRIQITQVLLNLMTNGMQAMEFTPVAERRLTLEVRKLEMAAVVSVKDRGCGLKPDNLQHIYDPFFTTRRDGTGMGLSISLSIALAHEGSLWGENSAEGGATFYLRLPISEAGSIVTLGSGIHG